MEAKKLENGNLLVPIRAESEGIIGDSMVEIGPDHPDYKVWLEWLDNQKQEQKNK